MNRGLTIQVLRSWLAALRSDKYPKGISYFRQRIEDIDYFCALGVLLDSNTHMNECKARWAPRPYNGAYEFITEDGSQGLSLLGTDYPFIPYKVWDEIPIRLIPQDKIPLEFRHRVYVCIPSLNDGFDLSFEEIADIVELHVIEMGLVTLEDLYPNKVLTPTYH